MLHIIQEKIIKGTFYDTYKNFRSSILGLGQRHGSTGQVLIDKQITWIIKSHLLF